MGRAKYHNDKLPGMLQQYARNMDVQYHRYSEYHMRLIYEDVAVLDVWTTEKYYVLTTDYAGHGGEGIIERGGEKGFVPSNKKKLYHFLDELLFAVDRK